MSTSSILLWILGVLTISMCIEVARITWYLVSTKQLVNIAQKFERRNLGAEKRILFIGDSVGCSTGASHERYSIIGRLGMDFPDAHIENLSEGQMRLSRASRILQDVHVDKSCSFDLVIILVGGMDIVMCTPLWSVRRTLRNAVLSSKQYGRETVLISPNNTGRVPLYRFPVSNFYRVRAKKFDSLYRDIAREYDIQCVSLFQDRLDALSVRTLFSPDKTHPNDDGYGIWYNKMKETFATALKNDNRNYTIKHRDTLEGHR